MATIFRPIPKKQSWDIFTLDKWQDSVNDPLFLEKWKATIAKNVVFTDRWWEKRNWITLSWQTWTTAVNWLWVIKRDAWDILIRLYWTALQKLVWVTWTNVAWWTFTSIKTSIVSYDSADLTSAAAKSWTWASTSTSRTFVPWVWGMTANAYAWSILLLLTGTWALQEKLITSNDLTTIYIEWIFETTPDATTTYAVRAVIPHVLITNGTDSVEKYDWTTLTAYATMTKWDSLIVAHNRLFGAREDLDYVYFSNLTTIYFSKESNIPIDPSGDVITQLQLNQDEVIIYKENSRHKIIWYNTDQFQLVTIDTRTWSIAPRSVVHWNNLNFFLWYGWIYKVWSLDNSTVYEWLPISVDINDSILAHSAADLIAAAGWVYDDKYFCSIWTDVYVYDILQSRKKKTDIWSIFNYVESITCAMVTNWVVYLWSANRTYTKWWTTDNTTEITCQVDSDRRDQNDNNAEKIYGVWFITFRPAWATCTVVVSASIEWWAYAQIASQDINTNWNIRFNVNKRWKDIKYKYTYWGTKSPEFLKNEQFYQILSKPV